MREKTLLKALGRVLRRVAPDAYIIYPNEAPTRQNISDALCFEASISNASLERETETTTSGATTGAVVVAGALNVGIGAVDEAAQALVDAFAPLKENGEAWVSEADGGKWSRAYIERVERSESGIYNDQFKVTIFIHFTIYEEFAL